MKKHRSQLLFTRLTAFYLINQQLMKAMNFLEPFWMLILHTFNPFLDKLFTLRYLTYLVVTLV